MNSLEFIYIGGEIAKVPLGIFGLVILATLLITLILFLQKYPSEKITEFWVKVLMILFRYKEN